MRALSVFIALLVSWSALPSLGQVDGVVPQEIVPEALPEPVVYWQMFRHVIALNTRADEMDRRGEDGSKLRHFYREDAGLDEAQAQLLGQIANECAAEVAVQDARALNVIRAYRAQYPKAAFSSKTALPPAPSELTAMQAERDAIVLRYRDRLRTALGESGFEHFRGFLRARIAPQIRRIGPGTRPTPDASQRPAGALPGAHRGEKGQ